MTLKKTITDNTRRRFLIKSSVVVGSVAGIAVATPFILSMLPSAKARSSGAPVEVDISKLEYGQQITVEWRGKPVWILRRDLPILERLKEDSLLTRLRDPESKKEQQPAYITNELRAIKQEYLVVVGICTHLGCVPTFRPDLAPADLGKDWPGGYFCPCHGSRFDFAGRVYKSMPAPLNLVIPPYHFMNESVIEIGTNPSQHKA